jgi:predicted transcriptional regulator
MNRKEIIKRSGYKKSYLAELLGMSPSRFTNWLHFKCPLGTIKTNTKNRVKLARMMRCKVRDLDEK